MMHRLPPALPAVVEPVEKVKVADLLEPVSANVISQIFDQIPAVTKKRLTNCRSVTDGKTNIRKYHIRDAAKYMIDPAFTPEDFIEIMSKNKLPNAINKEFWDAMLKKQKWEENAGDLWRTSRVREALTDTFQTIKFTMQLWVDSLERQAAISNEQRVIIVTMVDALQLEVYTSLVEQAVNGETTATIDENPHEEPNDG